MFLPALELPQEGLCIPTVALSPGQGQGSLAEAVAQPAWNAHICAVLCGPETGSRFSLISHCPGGHGCQCQMWLCCELECGADEMLWKVGILCPVYSGCRVSLDP